MAAVVKIVVKIGVMPAATTWWLMAVVVLVLV